MRREQDSEWRWWREPPETAVFPVELKAGAAGRTFTGYASTFGNVDMQGDMIDPGAFRHTLDGWKRSGKKLPLLDTHSLHSVRSIIGHMVEGRENDYGLLTTFKVVDGGDGDEVLNRVRSGLVDGLSIGFTVLGRRSPTDAEEAEGARRVLTAIELHEVSLVARPANELARVTAAKATRDAVRASHPLWQIDAKSLPLDQRVRLLLNRDLYRRITAILERADEMGGR